MSRGSRYALCHLGLSAFFLVLPHLGAEGVAIIPLLILFFPLTYLLWLLPPRWLSDHFSEAGGMFIGLCLMTVNSYLCGYTASFLQGWIARRRNNKTK
jgi:hypothetical protein